ncbi:signal recognition particle-docking protein FtsY [Streptomonospora litoralis]|uniref:Signal recognition particle receptor FtsY n=1 Tax=Streptomonospora litoralis TaxID=2498135 RepID=A0A4P6Q5V4_9ACTN|nr:signal recognition particle-docking protein FtsY [Streptomonospora litoralis]QBI55680.1 Signal recognition particle receptor FtsY [Streptomonospora litoralis]
MDYTIFAVIIFVVALLVVGGAFLIRPRRSEAPPKPRPGEREGGAAGTTTAEPEEAEERERPLDAAKGATPEAPAAPEVETPPPSAGRLVRLRARLARSQNAFGQGLLSLLSADRLDESAWEEIEDTLITADVGVASASAIVDNLRTKVKVLGSRTPEEVRDLLRTELLAQIGTDQDRTVHTEPRAGSPAVVMVVGVNGTGKTTTTGKLARVLVGDGRSVVLGAADTFRAAAADQLETWGGRVGAPVVRKEEGADPASVAFEAVSRGAADGADTVIVDTAGRLHTKTGLMDELGKVKRVIEKQTPVDDVLLVLDATTGQNGLRQARVFAEVVNISGIVLTKLDGTAKGGIIIQVQRELGVPVKLVGLGEGPDDLAPFDPEAFVDAILEGGE